MSEVTQEAAAQDTTNAAAPETKETQVETKPEVDAKANTSAPEVKVETKVEAKADAPDKYELKLPENSVLDTSAVERISAYAKQKGLTNDQAQMLLERESDAVSKFRQDQVENLKTQSETWKSELVKDKEFGGEAFNKNAELAKRVVEKYASKEFVETLESTGLGNHPELVRVFFRIAKAFGEDSFVVPGAQGASKKDLADVFYGN